MIAMSHRALTSELPRGSHVCWVVDDAADYGEVAGRLFGDGRAARQKTIAFGPEDGDALRLLRALADLTADPRSAFLGGGPLVPEAMFAAFREQFARARAEGFDTIRVVADMDWLLPARPTAAAIAAFELQLDRVVAELGATVVCAYRRASFASAAITGALCVHPVVAGVQEPPAFRLTAIDDLTWTLSGEVDLAVAETLAGILTAAGDHAPRELDVSGLSFIDVPGMRAIAVGCADGRGCLSLRGAVPRVRRAWQAAGFGRDLPGVELAA